LVTTVIALLGFIFSLWFGYHVLTHLPVWDFRAYKVGDNISQNMTLPENAQEEVAEWTWIINVNGKEKAYTTNGTYPNVNGELVKYEKEIIVEADEPKIFDFSIESDEEDLTQAFLNEDNLVVVVAYNLNYSDVNGMKNIKKITDEALQKGYKVIGLTASGRDEKAKVKADYNFNFDFYICDEKVSKTIVRSNPGILTLTKGTVLDKEHYNDVNDLELKRVGEPVIMSQPKPKEVKKETLYFVNDSLVTKQYADNIQSDAIKQVNVFKDSTLTTHAQYKENVEAIVEITLKQ